MCFECNDTGRITRDHGGPGLYAQSYITECDACRGSSSGSHPAPEMNMPGRHAGQSVRRRR